MRHIFKVGVRNLSEEEKGKREREKGRKMEGEKQKSFRRSKRNVRTQQKRHTKRREEEAQEKVLKNLSVKRRSQCHNMQEEESDCECPICGEHFGDFSSLWIQCNRMRTVVWWWMWKELHLTSIFVTCVTIGDEIRYIIKGRGGQNI